MLLARLEGQAASWLSRGIPRDADDTPRHLPFERFRSRKKGSVGATESERDSESLGGPDGDVGPELSW